MEHKVRLLNVEIKNIKNVLAGKIKIEGIKDSADGQYGNILGIYGQNGSGKTAFVDSCQIIKKMMSGIALKTRNEKNEISGKDYSKYINVNEKYLNIEYTFFLSFSDKNYKTYYNITLGKSKELFEILSEKLSYQIVDKNGVNPTRLTHFIDFDMTVNDSAPFTEKRMQILKQYDKESEYAIKSAKEETSNFAKSFVFSDKILSILKGNTNDEMSSLYDVLFILKMYARTELLIVDKKDIGFINIGDFIPLKIKHDYYNKEEHRLAIGTIPINTNKEITFVPRKIYELVIDVFAQINKVLPSLIPGLTVKINEIAQGVINEDGEPSVGIQLLSVRNGTEIDITLESEGIKKIICMLNYIVAMFNSNSVCLIVDEFDSDIFEYLIGELLLVIRERAEGQFIFTSHNLRPLEMINKKSIVFTTVNPSNRYYRMKNIKPSQNLRDNYYRAIQLGGQDEILYDETKSNIIKRSFRLAGKVD